MRRGETTDAILATHWRRWARNVLLLPRLWHLFLMLYFQDWFDRSLGYLTDNTQPTTLSIFHTATFTLTVPPFSLGSYRTFFFFFLILDSDVLGWTISENSTKKQKNYKLWSFVLFFLFFPFCVSVVCSCSVHVSAKTGWDIVTYLPQLHLTAALHNFQ